MPIDRRLLLFSPAAALPLITIPQTTWGGIPDEHDDRILLSDFDAKLDGVSDDSAALQRAINACLLTTPARPLYVNGQCRVEKSIFIDRRVDATRGIFRIIGSNVFGGFLIVGNFPLFDSRLDHPTEPRSEHIWFQNIRFEGLSSTPNAAALSDKFLRVQFHDCEFERIKALAGTKYAQEWHFSRCIAQRWEGSFFTSRGAYHVISSGGKYQNGGGAVFNIADPSLQSAGCVGCAFHQDIAESNSGPFIKAAVLCGLSVAGLYSEGNHGPTLDFDNNAPNRGVNITGCAFAPKNEDKKNVDLFDIRWGRIEAGHASGNYSTGRLHSHRAMTSTALSVQGDFANIELMRREK